MFNFSNQRVLVLAPHTDDAEFGCGGTIAKLVAQQNEVYSVAFSACQQSVLKDFPSDILVTEVKEASTVLGIPKDRLILLDYEVRTFNYRRQELLDDILKIKKEIDPQVIFIPVLNDLHQDHATIANEALRAFKFANIFGYELPWNNLVFRTSAFSILSEADVAKKVEAVNKYRSQAHRGYANEEFIRSLARVRGVQINEQYAECFELIRFKF
ncbi:MAG: PIG-L deacetylase family protein [Bacteroidota bacterium]